MNLIWTTCVSIAMLLCVVATADVNGAASADDPNDHVKAELKKLEGKWRLVRLEIGGKLVDTLTWGRDVQRIFSGTQSTFISGKRVSSERQIKVYGSKSRNWIDETIGKNEPLQGIYELNGNTLMLFFDRQGDGRPTEFKTRAGTQQAIETYERVKDAAN